MRLFILICILFLSSCSKNGETQIKDLTLKSGIAYLGDEQFSGVAFTFYLKPKKIKAIEENYKEGLLHGKRFQWDKSGRLINEQKYEMGKKSGLQKKYFDDGRVQEEVTYLDGRINGQKLSWYKSGKQHIIANYITDVLDSTYNDFFETAWGEPDKPKRISNYKKGLKHGNEKIYNKNGILIEEKNYIEDKLDGIVSKYDKLGNLFSQTPYKDNLREGTQILYYRNGNIKEENNFLSDWLDGTKKIYDENGKLITSENYRNGEKVYK